VNIVCKNFRQGSRRHPDDNKFDNFRTQTEKFSRMIVDPDRKHEFYTGAFAKRPDRQAASDLDW